MSMQRRDVPTTVQVCDLCNEILSGPSTDPGESGSLTTGNGRPVTATTKRAWLEWPPGERQRKASWEERQKADMKPRRYDFHADCILRLVEANLHGKEAGQ